MQNHLSAKLLAEFIGTFAFVFIGAGAAAVVGTGAGLNGIAAIAFAHGLTIMVFAFAYGNLSGAHFNPAVTVGVLAARAMSLGEAIAYIISQLVAGACAAFLLRAVLGGVAASAGPSSRGASFSAQQRSRSRPKPDSRSRPCSPFSSSSSCSPPQSPAAPAASRLSQSE
jgi:glycerol uptake facilitator-like aquaporin